jgi:hypothetical protein
MRWVSWRQSIWSLGIEGREERIALYRSALHGRAQVCRGRRSTNVNAKPWSRWATWEIHPRAQSGRRSVAVNGNTYTTENVIAGGRCAQRIEFGELLCFGDSCLAVLVITSDLLVHQRGEEPAQDPLSEVD